MRSSLSPPDGPQACEFGQPKSTSRGVVCGQESGIWRHGCGGFHFLDWQSMHPRGGLEERCTCGDALECGKEMAVGGTFHHESVGASLDRSPQVCEVFLWRQKQHSSHRTVLANGQSHPYSIHARKCDVDDGDVRLEAMCFRNGRRPVGHFRNHLHPRDRFEELAESRPHPHMVIRQ